LKLRQLVSPIVDIGVAHEWDIHQVGIALQLVETVAAVRLGLGDALPERRVLLTTEGDEPYARAADWTATRGLVDDLTADAPVVGLR
jgi:hypothetical protein